MSNYMEKAANELAEKMSKEIIEAIRKIIEAGAVRGHEDPLPGDIFTYSGVEFKVLDVIAEKNTIFAVTTKIVDTMTFSESGNDYTTSNVRKWIDEQFIKTIGTECLCAMYVDLTADNGDDDYDGLHAMAAPLSCNQYRKYKKLMPKYDDWVWTVTPWTCDPSNANIVRLIYPSGALYYVGSADYARGVAPACMFNLDNLKSRREAHFITPEESSGDEDE